ncbi:glycosyltransferase [Clostridioides sp. ZZV14-6045]|uniref:glycosyltransferase n=1 Tax=Clostridioides sp. ZZV14-6045 TaxID=2811489 RepID=UPI001D126E0D|nr:glycosyltransferase [Clostridioides sp. ZZV14-6045]
MKINDNDIDKMLNFISNYKYEENKYKNIRFTSIVILSYNQKKNVELSIESIRRFVHKEKYEIIVIDNNSNDGTKEWLKEQKDLNIIYNIENKKINERCNQAIDIVSGENILFFNPSNIITPNLIFNLNNALWSEEQIGAVEPTNGNLYMNQTSIEYNNLMESILDLYYKYNKEDESKWRDVTELNLSCMMIKKCALKDIDNLECQFESEHIMSYDISFSLIDKGYSLLCCMDTFIYNCENYTCMNEQHKLIPEKDLEKFIEKWGFSPIKSSYTKYNLISMIDEDKSSTLNILNIGHNTCTFLSEIKYKFKNASIYTTDKCEILNVTSNENYNEKSTNLEYKELNYKYRFFDYVILEDLSGDLKDIYTVLRKIKPYLKRDGFIITSALNFMHVDIIKKLLEGKLFFNELRDSCRSNNIFFTLEELKKIFGDIYYSINSISSEQIDISEDSRLFIEKICEVCGNELKYQYYTYKYFVKFKNDVDLNRYKNIDMINLKYFLMRIDNGVQVDHAMKLILNNYTFDEQLIEDIEHIVSTNIINKIDVLNKLGIESLNHGLFECSISIFILGLKVDRNDIDTIYNISYVLFNLGEYEMAHSIIDNSDSNVKKNDDLAELYNLLEERLYE